MAATRKTSAVARVAAAAADVTRFRLCRMFRRLMGTTMHAYREGLRLRAALDALEDPRADLTSIALDHGYSSHSHFTAAFRRAFGVPPSRVRERRPPTRP